MFDRSMYNLLKLAAFLAFVVLGGYTLYQAGYNGMDLLPPLTTIGGAVGGLVLVGAFIGGIIAILTDMVWLRIVAFVGGVILGGIFVSLASGLGEFFSSWSWVQVVLSLIAVFAIAVFGLWLSRRD
jgi:hypothetical protein